MTDERGSILLLTFILMVALTTIVGGVLFMITYESRDMASQIEDVKLLNLAEAGVERAAREKKDDISLTTQTGTAELRGNNTSGDAGTAANMGRIRYFNEGSYLNMGAGGAGTTVVLWNFDLNYLDTTIKSVKIGCRYAKSGGGGITPRLEVLYTTDGVFPQAGNSSFDTAVSSASYNAAPFVVLDITHDRAWTWSLLNNPNFQIRARAYNSSNRRVYLDYLFLQVTYGIDTLAEPWATGSFASFPIALGSGNITSVSLEDEQGKVNLNAASLSLLRYLLEECGVASGTALTLASSVVAYRATKPFDSVEELQQVSGMTAAVYNQIKDFVTVCSFVNASAARPSGSRSPVNVNTAPREVLEAVFDPLGLGATDPARLAADILSARAAAPFDCFYASVSAADFYDFVNSRSYLTATERNIVLDNADASALVPVYGYAGSNAVTTEFCYASGALAVDSLAGVGGRNFRVKTVLGQDGNATGYRKESFE